MLGRMSFFAVFLSACSSSETTTTTIDAGTESGTTTKDSGPSPTGDEACAAESTKLDCGNCCATVHEKGFDLFSAALVACDCEGLDGGAGACAAECATSLCSPSGQGNDATCSACVGQSIGSGGTCQEYVVGKCEAEPDCLAQQKCVLGCQKLK